MVEANEVLNTTEKIRYVSTAERLSPVTPRSHLLSDIGRSAPCVLLYVSVSVEKSEHIGDAKSGTIG